MDNNQKVFMQMDEPKESKIKQEIKEQSTEFIFDSLTDNIDIKLSDGVAIISMPEPLFIVLSSLLKKFFTLTNTIKNDMGVSR